MRASVRTPGALVAGDDAEGLADLALATGTVAHPGRPPRRRSPHTRHRKTVERLRESPMDLPPRLSLFGHTRLPVTDIDLLCQLATHHDLHLWLPHPSDALWQASTDARGVIPRRDDKGHRDVGHPLFGTLGRDLRELQRSLPADVASDEYLPGGSAPRPCSAGCSRTSPPMPFGRRAVRSAPTTVGADPQLPQSGPPDRRAARGAGRVARRRSDAGAARHPRHVPGHRDVRTADRRRLRAGRRQLHRSPRAPTAGPPGRPRAHPDQSATRGHRTTAGVVRRPGDGQRGDQSRSRATDPEQVRVQRRRPRRNHRHWSASRTSAGVSTRSTARSTGCTASCTTPGGSDSTGCSSAWRCRRTRTRGWENTLPLDDVSSNRIELTGRFAEFVDRLQTGRRHAVR